MYQAEYKGINAFLKGSCQLLLEEGRKRETRGKVCYELPEPYMFKIVHPTARIVTIPERKWYASLPYAESLWLASGRNNMEFIRKYLSRMDAFSDDKIFMRGGYGPRFRHFNGDSEDYKISGVQEELSSEVDQFRYVVECFHEDLSTRRAIITIGDPMKDDFDENRHLKQTLDIPCTRMLHFMKDSDTKKLNLVVSMRSNDLIWGAGAVNVFNFTFMQEYFAAILGLEVGSYYHIANNFHFYEDKRAMVEAIASAEDVEDTPYIYEKTFNTLASFDSLLGKLSEEELKIQMNPQSYQYYEFDDPFFRDWYNVLYTCLQKKQVDFINPSLRDLRYSIYSK